MFKTVSPHIPKWLIIAFAVIALIGFADASYLTAEHFRGVIPPCTVTQGCESVLTSTYAVIAGVPVSALGMIYYGALLVLMIAFFDSRNQRVLTVACWMTGGGFLGTLYFLYLQAFVIHAFCQYCLLSALTSTILLGLSIRILRTP